MPRAASLCVWSREGVTVPWPLPVKSLLDRRGKDEAALGKAGRNTPGISFSVSLGLAPTLSHGIQLPVREVAAVPPPRRSGRSGAERWLLPAVLCCENSPSCNAVS